MFSWICMSPIFFHPYMHSLFPDIYLSLTLDLNGDLFLHIQTNSCTFHFKSLRDRSVYIGFEFDFFYVTFLICRIICLWVQVSCNTLPSFPMILNTHHHLTCQLFMLEYIYSSNTIILKEINFTYIALFLTCYKVLYKRKENQTRQIKRE